jgi:deoxycytidylate deaminase
MVSKDVIDKCIQLGIKLARNSPIYHRYASILIHNNKIIAYGYNTIRHNSKNNKYTPFKFSIHAEEACIRNCSKKFLDKDITMVLIRIDRNNTPIYCKPCDKCQKLITSKKIKVIIPFY